MAIELGDVVRDSITGFEGVALSKITSLHEATQFRVQPQTLIAGAIAAAVWIEETRLARRTAQERQTGFAGTEAAHVS